MIKGAGDYIGGFLGPAGSEHAGPDIPASRARVSRGSGVCRGDAIIVRGRRRGGPGSCKTPARSSKERFARFSKPGEKVLRSF